MNPFFNSFQPQKQPSMLEQFSNFASNFRGDPKRKVEELLSSGKMTREQFNEYSQIANNFSSLFRR